MSDVNDISSDGNVETMLSVEKGLRELASLKVFLKLELCVWTYMLPQSFNCMSARQHDQFNRDMILTV